MELLDTKWDKIVNVHIIRCDCGMTYSHEAWYSVTVCPRCNRYGLVYANEVDHPRMRHDCIVRETWLKEN